MNLPLIAIDGPAGAGKSTTSRSVALKLGIPYLDTGAMYRAAAWYFVRDAVNLNSSSAVERHIANCRMMSAEGIAGTRIWIYEKTQRVTREVSSELRSPELTKRIGPVCEHPDVRSWLVELQREWAECGFGVMEGRDIGTVVLPDAGLKIYLTARPEIRAVRRGKELGIDGDPEPLAKLTNEIAERDSRDSQREHSPLKPAEDAVIIDTSNLTFDAQVNEIINLAGERFDLKIYG